RLKQLVNKWFFGLDRPSIPPGYSYEYASGVLDNYTSGAAVHYTDIKQGDLGDCYFLSSLGGVALKDPTSLTDNFIEYDGGQTFTVRFFNNGVADYVTVDRYLPVNSNHLFVYANSGQAASNPGNILWVALAEKAYAQVDEEGWIGQANNNSY